MDFKSEEMCSERGDELAVGSTTKAKAVAIGIESDTDAVSVDLTPSEARALAALLLKHADRAEGKT